MATAASQVILHPVVSQSLKFGSTTLGRDKTYRAVQYFARFFAWYLLRSGDKVDAARWNALKSHLGTARKLLRLGKPVEHLQAALRAALATGPPTEQITTIARQIAYFGFLSYDVIVWANAIKFINLNSETAKRVSKTSNRFWLAGILFSIVNSVLKTVRLTKESKQLRAAKSWGEKDVGEETQRQARLHAVKAAQAAARRQFTIDLLDVWIPATGAEVVQVNEGTLGIFGLISSLMGMQAQWKAVSK
ncbi:Peroxisomal membrane protein PMP27 [Hypsizygus marmoreus]|uniref:Peroxisomal membrane protein PMP27 n=1 Tax=Hypsizygus marmoreus TaxID=39966 RepID=A0A369K7D4_HYPMA|nr:Peroxisomal membrane protein PMP27 [Hypsizygus marmoreus]